MNLTKYEEAIHPDCGKVVENYKDITITPFLMQSIGKASRYMYQERTDKQRLMNTTPSIEDLFEFI